MRYWDTMNVVYSKNFMKTYIELKRKNYFQELNKQAKPGLFLLCLKKQEQTKSTTNTPLERVKETGEGFPKRIKHYETLKVN